MAYVASKLQGLLDKNGKFAETFQVPPTMEQLRAASREAGGAFIIRMFPISSPHDFSRAKNTSLTSTLSLSLPYAVTCLDPRSVPEQFFGPELGAAVIRNAGGRATKDVITSITVLRSLANAAAVFVIHHTGTRDLSFSLFLIAAWNSSRRDTRAERSG